MHPPPTLFDRLVSFAGAMRASGLAVQLGDELDAAAALRRLDLLDRDEVRRGLRIALKVPHESWPAFDRLFDEHWGSGPAAHRPRPPPLTRDHRGARLGATWKWDGTRVRLLLPEDEAPVPEGEEPGYSAEPVLRRKPFDRVAPHELAAMARLVAELALRLAARRSRRLVPTRGRGVVDLRRSFRGALATDGDFLRLARRTRALQQPRLVLLADTSGSMDPYTRFHLAFAFALRRVIRRVEIFAFNTALARVTQAVDPLDTAWSLQRLAADVPDWSGGTRIGACLSEFVAVHAGSLVGRDTTVVIVSDGLDLGDVGELGAAMRELHRRARRIVWLNPLAGDPRFEPTAAGMRAALPHVDHFGPGHDVESLERLTRLLD
jgi:uncharacterized protein with von Willebrand factor type A (vWA) domain